MCHLFFSIATQRVGKRCCTFCHPSSNLESIQKNASFFPLVGQLCLQSILFKHNFEADRIKRVGRSKLIQQTNLTEPDVEFFMNLTH